MAASIPFLASVPLNPFGSIPPIVQVIMPGDAKGGRFVRWGGLHGRLCLADGDLALEVIWEDGKDLSIFEILCCAFICIIFDKQILIIVETSRKCAMAGWRM